MGLNKAWDYEQKHHLGDYGDSSEYDLYCAFKAGWLACKRSIRKSVIRGKNNGN